MESEQQSGEIEQIEVELETTVIDSADIADIGLYELADEIVEIGGEPNDAGTLPERVRIRGTVYVEEVDDET